MTISSSKKGNEFEYLPVEKNAAKHSYNWDNLVHYSREKDYVVNGSSRVVKWAAKLTSFSRVSSP